MQMFQTKDSNLLSLMQSQLSSAPLHLLHTDSWLDPQKYTWFRIYGLRFCPPKFDYIAERSVNRYYMIFAP